MKLNSYGCSEYKRRSRIFTESYENLSISINKSMVSVSLSQICPLPLADEVLNVIKVIYFIINEVHLLPTKKNYYFLRMFLIYS